MSPARKPQRWLVNQRDSNPIGSDDWFVAELTRHQRSIYVLILSTVQARSDADDIYQSVCMTLWRRRGDFDPTLGSFRAWAKGIARNLIRNYVRVEGRRQRRVVFSEQLVEQLLETEAGHAGALDDRAEALRHCLQQLGEKQRRLIEHYYERRNTVDELAKLFNMGARTVFRQVDAIRLALLNCVTRRTRGGTVS